jgi:GNAT superfamily N-acetyltransferase
MIRPATAADLAAVQAIVDAGFSVYIPRIGRKPAPMLSDYAALIAGGSVHVLEDAGAVIGVAVIADEPDVLYLDTVAVDPAHRGRGHGRALLAFAEMEARRRGFAAIRLCTNEKMVENQAMYVRLGWTETHRGEEDGLRRVFYRKDV